MEFKKAERKQAKLRLALTGPSGSGKTWSALVIASGIGKKIALIDTENHSASLYSGEKGIPEFDTLEIEPPYTITKYLDAMKLAEAEKYDVVIVDSLTHAWAGEGGLLEKKGAMDARGGNSYTNWFGPTREHEQLKSEILHIDTHLIATIRSKQDYIMEENSKGKMAPRKVGLAPVQREGLEYEFTMALDMAMDHNASISKTRVAAFDGRIFKPTRKTGEELLAWLVEGKAPESQPAPITPAAAKQDPVAPILEATASPAAEDKAKVNIETCIPISVTAVAASHNKKAYWVIEDLKLGTLYTMDDLVANDAALCVEFKKSMQVSFVTKVREGKLVGIIVASKILEPK